MMGVGIWQFLVFMLPFFIPTLFSIFILNKAGYFRWWALLFLIPLVNIIMIWIFAFARWPAFKEAQS